MRPWSARLAVLLFSCGGPVPSGLYSLEQLTVSDTCSPPSVSGQRGIHEVRARADGGYQLSFDEMFLPPTLDGGGFALFPVRSSLSFGWETTRITLDGTCIDRSLSGRLLATGPTLEAELIREYEFEPGCVGSSVYGPTASCRVEQRLRYQLVTPCEPPCTVERDEDFDGGVLGPSDGPGPRPVGFPPLVCSCPG